MKSGFSVSHRSVSGKCELHWHNYIEMELITTGEGEQIYNGKTFPLKRGTVSILRLIDCHSVIPKNNLHLINLSFDECLLSEDILSALSSPLKEFCFEINQNDFHTLEGISLLCLNEAGRDIPNRRYLKTLLKALFIKLFEAADINCELHSTERAKLTPFRRSLEYIHSHFRENPSLSEVAEIAHYNPSHFSVVFRREMGETYSKYLNNLKLNYAKELLGYTDLKFEEICFECGFTSYANFLRIFKEKNGISPSEYKEKNCIKTNLTYAKQGQQNEQVLEYKKISRK